MRKYKVEYVVSSRGNTVDDGRIFVEAQNSEEAEIKAYDQLDKEYDGIGRVLVLDVR